MLDYSLHENPLTERKDDFAAQTHSKTSYTKEQFIDLMLQRGTMVTKTDILAVLNNMEETAAYIVKNGGTLNLPLFNLSYSISGVFESATDMFDPKRHKLRVNIHKGTVLRDAEKEIKLEKVNMPSPQPQILEVKDSVSGKVDEILTNGGVAEINGFHVKITGLNESCGLYFVDDYGSEIKAVTLVENKPSKLIVIIPPLSYGMYYRIKIITQFSGGGTELKEPRTTIFHKPLQAQ
jgi:hypothetical protein